MLCSNGTYHVNENGDCSSCEISREKKFVSRKDREDRYPVVHRGLILSGRGVIKNPLDRERLCHNRDEICYETHAAGIMNEIPCLVIRGICEYAYTHKQNGWRYYAAAVAAVYCKAIFRKVKRRVDENNSAASKICYLNELQLNAKVDYESVIRGTVDSIDLPIDLKNCQLKDHPLSDTRLVGHKPSDMIIVIDAPDKCKLGDIMGLFFDC